MSVMKGSSVYEKAIIVDIRHSIMKKHLSNSDMTEGMRTDGERQNGQST